MEHSFQRKIFDKSFDVVIVILGVVVFCSTFFVPSGFFGKAGLFDAYEEIAFVNFIVNMLYFFDTTAQPIDDMASPSKISTIFTLANAVAVFIATTCMDYDESKFCEMVILSITGAICAFLNIICYRAEHELWRKKG